MIRSMLITQFCFFCVYGAVFGVVLARVEKQAVDSVYASLPSETYMTLPLVMLMNIPVVK